MRPIIKFRHDNVVETTPIGIFCKNNRRQAKHTRFKDPRVCTGDGGAFDLVIFCGVGLVCHGAGRLCCRHCVGEGVARPQLGDWVVQLHTTVATHFKGVNCAVVVIERDGAVTI